MYNKIKVVPQVRFNYEHNNDGIILIKEIEKSSYLAFYDSDFENEFVIKPESAYDFIRFDKNVLFTNRESNKTFLFNSENKTIITLPYVLHLKGYLAQNLIACYSNIEDKECYLLVSISSFEIVKKIEINKLINGIYRFNGKNFISKYKNIVTCNNIDGEENWKADFSEIGSYTDMLGRFYKGEVKNVYLYENKVIVLAGAAIVAFDLNTGETLWQHTKTPVYHCMALHDNQGYLTTGAVWGVLNLESGELENRGKFPDIQHKGKNFWATGGELTWHDGLLWLNVFSSGYAFIVALNPQTGNYEWGEEVETTEAIKPPKFHGNRMYLLDTGRTLHVYEKE